MNDPNSIAAISPLRQRMIDDMNVRRFSGETQRNYIRDVGRFATFLGRSPDTATADDVRRFQIEQREAGVPTPTMNSIVSALRFFFTQTIDRSDLARKLVRDLTTQIPVIRRAARTGRNQTGCSGASTATSRRSFKGFANEDVQNSGQSIIAACTAFMNRSMLVKYKKRSQRGETLK